MGTFEWSGFGVHLAAPDPTFEVLWRSDSKYFAIKYEADRGWTTGTIYGRNDKGDWTELKLPDDEIDAAVKKMGGVKELHGKGCESPRQWLNNGDLELLIRGQKPHLRQTRIWEKEFMVDLKVTGWLGHTLKTAKIVSIKLKSKEETEKDLSASRFLIFSMAQNDLHH